MSSMKLWDMLAPRISCHAIIQHVLGQVVVQRIFVAHPNGCSNTIVYPQGFDRLEIVGRHWVVRANFVVDKDVGHMFL